MATLSKPLEEVKRAIDVRIRAGIKLNTTQAEIAENNGGHADWLVLFANWREATANDLTALYKESEVGRMFIAITETGGPHICASHIPLREELTRTRALGAEEHSWTVVACGR